eukprot:7145379-Prymnesium_polylepis.2
MGGAPALARPRADQRRPVDAHASDRRAAFGRDDGRPVCAPPAARRPGARPPAARKRPKA